MVGDAHPTRFLGTTQPLNEIQQTPQSHPPISVKRRNKLTGPRANGPTDLQLPPHRFSVKKYTRCISQRFQFRVQVSDDH
jgi:hypothetical protein